MAYLYRNNKCEFTGTRKQIICYILQAYEDDYWVQQYNNQLFFDSGKLFFVIECLGLKLYQNKPKKF